MEYHKVQEVFLRMDQKSEELNLKGQSFQNLPIMSLLYIKKDIY